MTLPSHLKDLITQEAERLFNDNITGRFARMKFLDGATFLYNYLSKGPGAGVWVKACNGLPIDKHSMDVHWRYRVSKRPIYSNHHIAYGKLVLITAGINKEIDLDDLEYLDESALPSSELIRALERIKKIREDLVLPIANKFDHESGKQMAIAINEMYWSALNALSTHQNTDK